MANGPEGVPQIVEARRAQLGPSDRCLEPAAERRAIKVLARFAVKSRDVV
jgi:hypothetical protein